MCYPKVSVIVPFYNISGCVDYCLSSLLEQTYANYEVICVDDGSTDSTAKRIEDLARSHDRIKLYRKENGGLSDARNYGIARSSGEYITFVDGDDLVSPFYLDVLMKPIIEDCCDISICRHQRLRASEYPFDDVLWDLNTEYEIVSESEAVSRLLYGTPMISAWAHMAKKEVYERNPFPAGRVYEDTLTFGAHIMGFSKYAICAGRMYGYVLRTGSITSQASACCSRMEELGQALSCLRATVLSKSPELEEALVYHESIERCRMLVRIRSSESGDERLGLIQEDTVNFLRASAKRIRKNNNVSVLDKIRIQMATFTPGLYCFVVRLLGKIAR